MSSDAEDRAALLLRIAAAGGDPDLYKSESVERLRRDAAAYERAAEEVRKRGRLAALWSQPFGRAR